MRNFGDLKVLELGRVFSGPLCGMILADMGARVIKVERPGVGDESRRFGAHRAGGESCYFNSLNRGKRSVALDLKAEADRALFIDLLEQADVLVHNWIQASLDKLGFSWEAVHALNPRLIYCAISGYGPSTPFAARPSQDLIAQALSGLMSLTGEADGPPLRTAVPVVDYATGLYAAFTIAAALYQRERTGIGQRTGASLLQTALAMTAVPASEHLSTGATPQRTGNRHPSICPYNLYATTDGHIVVAVANDGMWRRFCGALRRDDLVEDPRFTTNAARIAHQEALEAILSEEFGRWSASEALKSLESARVSCAKVNEMGEVFDSPAVAALDQALECAPGVRVVGSPFFMEGIEAPEPSAPPALDADGAKIRRDRGW